MFAGPIPRDDLVSWTTAPSAAESAGVPLAMSALPWPGRLVVPGSEEQAVFVRATENPAGPAAPAAEVFYVHGIAGAAANWTSLAGLLSPLATGYAADLPGSGRSDPPRSGDYSIREQVRVLAAVIREVARGPVHLVGNSLGGFISTHLAAAHPELFRSVTLISPAVPDFRLTSDRGADFRLGVLLAPGLPRLVEPRLMGIPASARVRGMADLCFGDPSVVTDEDNAVAVVEYAWRAELPWAQHAVIEQLRGLMKSYLTRTGRSYWAAAARVRVPTLVVWGTRDRLVDVRLARRTADAFPDGRLLVLGGVGHVAQMEAPAAVARAIAALWSGIEHPDGRPVAIGTAGQS